jgi:hypothetical protein
MALMESRGEKLSGRPADRLADVLWIGTGTLFLKSGGPTIGAGTVFLGSDGPVQFY